jgi:hypothetical protein
MPKVGSLASTTTAQASRMRNARSSIRKTRCLRPLFPALRMLLAEKTSRHGDEPTERAGKETGARHLRVSRCSHLSQAHKGRRQDLNAFYPDLTLYKIPGAPRKTTWPDWCTTGFTTTEIDPWTSALARSRWRVGRRRTHPLRMRTQGVHPHPASR